MHCKAICLVCYSFPAQDAELSRGGIGWMGCSQHISFLHVSGFTMGTSHSLPSHHRSVIQPYFLSRSFSVALSNCSLMRVCVCVCVCRFSWISRSCEDVVGSLGGGCGGCSCFPVALCCNIALTFPSVKTASNALSARIRL